MLPFYPGHKGYGCIKALKSILKSFFPEQNLSHLSCPLFVCNSMVHILHILHKHVYFLTSILKNPIRASPLAYVDCVTQDRYFMWGTGGIKENLQKEGRYRFISSELPLISSIQLYSISNNS